MFHLSNVVRSILSHTLQFIGRNSKNEQEKPNYCSQWQCEFSAQIGAFLTGQNVELMGQPSHSPDLAPNDFFLFKHIKKILHGQRFSPNTNFCYISFSSHCKQHKWFSYVKTFWVQLCLKMSNFPIAPGNSRNMSGKKVEVFEETLFMVCTLCSRVIIQWCLS